MRKAIAVEGDFRRQIDEDVKVPRLCGTDDDAELAELILRQSDGFFVFFLAFPVAILRSRCASIRLALLLLGMIVFTCGRRTRFAERDAPAGKVRGDQCPAARNSPGPDDDGGPGYGRGE
jgi:hypothetical protein